MADIFGTNGDDTLTGTDDDDSIRGGSAAEPFGDVGDDLIRGGDGDDTLAGLDGRDTLFGEGGDDFLRGGNGRNVVEGGDGNDSLSGASFEDTLIGGDGDDALTDSLFRDEPSGSTVTFDNDAVDLLEGGDGNDTLRSSGGADVLRGGAGDDAIRFTVFADPAEDRLREIAVRIDGGEGFDTADFTLFNIDRDDVTFDALAANGRVFGNRTVVLGIEAFTVVASDGDDTIRLGNGDDRAGSIAGQGDDLLEGRDGNDTLRGGDGHDTLLGGDGRDVLIGGPDAGRDRIEGGRGGDLLITEQNAPAFPDTLVGGAGRDRFAIQDVIGGGNAAAAIITDFVSGQDRVLLDANDYFEAASGNRIPARPVLINATGEADPDAIRQVIYNTTTGELLYLRDFTTSTGDDAPRVIAILEGSPALTLEDFRIVANVDLLV